MRIAEQAVEQGPRPGGSLNTLGVAYYRLGRYEEALAILEKSWANGENAHDSFFLAMVHCRLGRLDKAQGFFRRGEPLMAGWRDAGRIKEVGRIKQEAQELLGKSD